MKKSAMEVSKTMTLAWTKLIGFKYPILIANECLVSRIRYGASEVLCKLDLEKAYDHVHWSFVGLMLARSGSLELCLFALKQS